MKLKALANSLAQAERNSSIQSIPASMGALGGNYSNSVDIMGVQYRHTF